MTYLKSFSRTRLRASLLLLGWLSSAIHPSRADETAAGVPWTGEAGITEQMGSIMKRPEPREHAARIIRVHKHGTTELVEYVSDAAEPIPTGSGPVAAAPGSTAQTVANTFLGATLADCLAYPPDTMGAVGPSEFIVALNGRIRSFNKATGTADGAINVDTDAFFASVMTPTSVNFTSDPRIRFDRLSQRWFIIMLDVPNGTGATPNRIMLAVSDGPVITGSSVWTFFQFQHDLVTPQSSSDTGKFADYPTLGIDANALYIGVNIFGTRGQGSFANTTAFVVRKSSLLGAGPIVVTAFRKLISNGPSSGPYTPQGVDNFDPASTEGYLLGVDANYYGKLQLRRISDPGGTPSISANVAITLPMINGGTINVPHLGNTGGTAGNLDGLDYRLLAAHCRNGRLWTTANIAVDNTGSASGTDTRMGVRWYELDGIATGQTPGVVQSGTVFDPSAGNSTTNRNFWMGTAMVSGQGHVAMGFSVAGANEYINAGTVGRLKNDAAGTMRTPLLYTASTSAYNPRDSSGNPIERWGDYSYTSLDPDDDMTMWTVQEWCVSPNYYGVQIAKLLAPPPATPVSASPSALTNGQANLVVTVTGSVLDGEGFFDPGAGFPKHLTASVSGTGVTVSSVTYNNPTNLTLSVNIAANATSGPRTLTVSNPDGQTASAPGLLTIATVASSNHPPVLEAITNRSMDELGLLSFTASGSDPDGNALTYSLGAGAPAGAVINASSGQFQWTPSEAQGPDTNTISVIVTDNGSPSLSATQSFSVTIKEVNAAPVFTATPTDTMIAELTTLRMTNSASDSDLPAQPLIYSLVNAPQNATIGSDGVITFTPNEAQGPGGDTLTTVVSDGTISVTNSFTVAVSEVNVAPVFSRTPTNILMAELTLLTVTNTATDADLPANALTYALVNPPTNAVINTNGVITWTPNEAQGPSSNVLTTVASDGTITITNSFEVIVAEVNTAPHITTIPSWTIHAGMMVTFTNSAGDADLPANGLLFSLDAGAPAAASVSPATGVFTWATTDADAGTTNGIGVRVTDDGDPVLSTVSAFIVTVAQRPQIVAITRSSNLVTIEWNTIPGLGYRLQRTPDLESFSWQDVAAPVTAVGTTTSQTDDTSGADMRFYRIRLE